MKKFSKIQFEPKRGEISCIYCGDAPVHHGLFYFTSLISTTLDNHIIKVTKHAPVFLKNFVDYLLYTIFDIFLFLHLAELSEDIDKAQTFRSRVVWEEARKRGIKMEQLILFHKPIDQYHTVLHGRDVYFNSLPIPQRLLNMQKDWDDKFVLKNEFSRNNIPVPKFFQFSVFLPFNSEKIFSLFEKPIIVKPRVGSRGRHTVTNIHTLEQFNNGINVVKRISAYLMAEEHLYGDVCRATFVNGKLLGFYRGSSPFIIGDGKQTIRELILEKDKNRPERVEKILINQELENYILRSGFRLEDVLPVHKRLTLTYRTGRLSGGVTKEMLDELHPSFIPFLKKAADLVDLPVLGFDCIVPDPTRPAETQRWGIIECNTLPFIDLHYYALEGKPKNIAGAIWDLWLEV